MLTSFVCKFTRSKKLFVSLNRVIYYIRGLESISILLHLNSEIRHKLFKNTRQHEALEIFPVFLRKVISREFDIIHTAIGFGYNCC